VLDVELNIRDVDGRAVVALCGELDLAGSPGAGSHLIVALAACGPSVIVDLTGLMSLSYSGLSMLLRVRKWAVQNGGDLLLAAPQWPVRLVLEATGLVDVFSVYRSVEEAATGMKPARAWSPAALERSRAGAVTRSGSHRRVYPRACPGQIRPARSSGTCRPRHKERDTWTRCRPCFLPRSSRGNLAAWP
jgi:anti-sigma B factor antagonist